MLCSSVFSHFSVRNTYNLHKILLKCCKNSNWTVQSVGKKAGLTAPSAVSPGANVAHLPSSRKGPLHTLHLADPVPRGVDVMSN